MIVARDSRLCVYTVMLFRDIICVLRVFSVFSDPQMTPNSCADRAIGTPPMHSDKISAVSKS